MLNKIKLLKSNLQNQKAEVGELEKQLENSEVQEDPQEQSSTQANIQIFPK